jgi:hypothetical protein
MNNLCTCLPQHTGISCEKTLTSDHCSSHPCKNKGTCLIIENNYFCKCQPNYSGFNCEIRINYCSSSPCLSTETCVDQLNGYTCIDTCSSQPCKYGSCLSMVIIFI